MCTGHSGKGRNKGKNNLPGQSPMLHGEGLSVGYSEWRKKRADFHSNITSGHELDDRAVRRNSGTDRTDKWRNCHTKIKISHKCKRWLDDQVNQRRVLPEALPVVPFLKKTKIFSLYNSPLRITINHRTQMTIQRSMIQRDVLREYAKIASPKSMFHGLWLETVRVLSSYECNLHSEE